MNTERILALASSAIYVVVALIGIGREAAFAAAVLSCVPLALIWFAESIGDYTGWVGGLRVVDKATPGGAIRFMGWVFLLAPLVVIVATRLFRAG